jgi:hypothetical protein
MIWGSGAAPPLSCRDRLIYGERAEFDDDLPEGDRILAPVPNLQLHDGAIVINDRCLVPQLLPCISSSCITNDHSTIMAQRKSGELARPRTLGTFSGGRSTKERPHCGAFLAKRATTTATCRLIGGAGSHARTILHGNSLLIGKIAGTPGCDRRRGAPNGPAPPAISSNAAPQLFSWNRELSTANQGNGRPKTGKHECDLLHGE